MIVRYTNPRSRQTCWLRCREHGHSDRQLLDGKHGVTIELLPVDEHAASAEEPARAPVHSGRRLVTLGAILDALSQIDPGLRLTNGRIVSAGEWLELMSNDSRLRQEAIFTDQGIIVFDGHGNPKGPPVLGWVDQEPEGA